MGLALSLITGIADRALLLVLVLCLQIFIPAQSYAGTPPGTDIDNTAEVRYSVSAVSRSAISNTVTNTTTRSPSTLDFLLHSPVGPGDGSFAVGTTEYDSSGSGSFRPLAPPSDNSGNAIDISSDVPLRSALSISQGDALFLRLTDLDANTDDTARDTALVVLTVPGSNESETLLLMETTNDSGVFVGYIQTATPGSAANDGVLSVLQNQPIAADYVDAGDSGDVSLSQILVDPFGLVFDSQTGQRIDGAKVSLFNADTGAAATVYGDDGVSLYPSSLISGGGATDANGTVYTFEPGGYRFPLMPTGNYYLTIEPPAGYTAPSQVPAAALQSVTAFNANIVPGSRGETFVLQAGPPLRIDIPLDAQGASLYVTKSVDRPRADIGDFVRYEIQLRNNDSASAATTVELRDTLPAGVVYQRGSSRLNDQPLDESSIQSNGRSLTFDLLNPAFGEIATVSYVAYLGAGLQSGMAVNRVQALGDDGTLSNTAQASVAINDPFNRDQNTLLGSVGMADCPRDGDSDGDRNDEGYRPTESDSENWQGVSGVRFFMEDGTNVVSDERGLFHFVGVEKGSHVVQLDLDSLPPGYQPVLCNNSNRFSGRAFSQFVDIQSSALWRTDFYLAPPVPDVADVALQMHTRLHNDVLEYRIVMQGGSLALGKRKLTVMLPAGTRYNAGSSKLDGAAIVDPAKQQGVLSFGLADVAQGWQQTLSFSASVVETATELQSKALLLFATDDGRRHRTPLAETSLTPPLKTPQVFFETAFTPLFATFEFSLAASDQQALREMADYLASHIGGAESVRLQVVGHTDNVPIRGLQTNRPKNNKQLSLARARAVGQFLLAELGLPASQLSLLGLGADEPRASNATAEGRALNRRVDIRLLAEAPPTANSNHHDSARSELQSITVQGPNATITAARAAQPNSAGVHREKSVHISTPLRISDGAAPSDSALNGAQRGELVYPVFDQAWFNQVAPHSQLVWPAAGYSPSIPSTRVAVLHARGQRPQVSLNGLPVNALTYEGMTQGASGEWLLSQWNGVALADGDNVLHIEIFDERGGATTTFKRSIHYSRAPVQVNLLEENSTLIADGKHALRVAVKLLDDQGHPVRSGVVGSYRVDPPYASVQELERLQNDPLAGVGTNHNQFQVGRDGIAILQLQPSTQTGKAVIRFDLLNGEEEIEAWVEPAARDWILVAIAEGTATHRTLQKNIELLQDSGQDKFDTEGHVSLYAKGRVRGDWLMTMAYNSASESEVAKNDLFQNVAPDRYYTLYGDRAEQLHDAASQRKLYLKIERQQFYAMFGDYHTGLTVTELARYQRSFNGFKSEFNHANYEYSAFASETGRGYVKDELRGDGTSGYYKLSAPPLVNSEKIILETRDRFRNEIVLSQMALRQHVDYDIDYDAARLYMRQPITANDRNFNPQFIVVDYETESHSDKGTNYGGRAGIKLLDKKLKLGASFIHDDAVQAEGDLQALDLNWEIGSGTRFKAEFASSERQQDGLQIKGDALLAELSHNKNGLHLRAYHREQEGAYGLGQQRAHGADTKKDGLEASYRITNQLDIAGLGYRETIVSTDEKREVLESRLNYRADRLNTSLGLRQVDDEQSDLQGGRYASQSQQALLGVDTRFMKNRLKLHANHEYNVSNAGESVDFPDRTRLGANFKASQNIDVFAEQEFQRGDGSSDQLSRVGLQATPWRGAAMTTGIGRNLSEYGSRVFANAGLRQIWQVNPRWAIDTSIDRSQSVGRARKPFNPNASEAETAQSDYTAVSLGNAYHFEDWSLTSRVEWREADAERRLGVSLGTVGEPVTGLALSSRLSIAKLNTSLGRNQHEIDLRLGLARRHEGGRLTLLNRLDYSLDKYSQSDESKIWSLTNNLNANYRYNARHQFSVFNGLRYKQQFLDAQDYSGFFGLLGGEWRYDFARRFDLGAHANVMFGDQHETSYGVSLGVSAIDNTWLSVGYNFARFKNDEFNAASTRSAQVYLRFRLKLDQQSVKDIVGRGSD